jgi:tRNA pseudouridine13 synthase
MSKPCKQRYGKKSSNKFFKSRFKGKSNNLSNSQSHKEYQHQDQFQEVDVGITEFISKFDGYSGVIKARFSDFQVNEIDLNGDVAKLTDLQIPADFQSKEEAVDGGEEVPVDTPLSQIPQKTWDAIKQMIDSSEAREVELNAEETTKEEREKIHECLKKVFARKIVCNTGTKDGIRTMIFKKYSGKNSDRRFKWPKDKGEYVHFLVYKECLDTLETTLKVATCLKMSPSHLTYAGVKDKRAKTTQWFSIKKVEPWKLIVKTRPLKNVRIGNITFKDKPLKLGELVGNKFRIALRNVTGDDDLIEKSLQSLKENGFINYYGLQRFGNDKEVPTFSIGVQLLLGNWKEVGCNFFVWFVVNLKLQACQIILKPTKADQPDFDISKAKKVYAETGDAAKALEQFDGSRNTCIEFLLLSGLSKGHANDFVNALTSVSLGMNGRKPQQFPLIKPNFDKILRLNGSKSF